VLVAASVASRSALTTRVAVAVGTGVRVGTLVGVGVAGSAVAVGAGVAVQAAATRVMACVVLTAAAAWRSLCAGSQIVIAATRARMPSRTKPAIATAM
jgi:hypothetical protein